MVSLRIDVPIRLPAEICGYLEQRIDVESRALRLGFRVADVCSAQISGNTGEQQFASPEGLAHLSALQTDLDVLEAELHLALPYESKLMNPKTYPKWYWPISMHPGSPKELHSYPSVHACSVWNTYRMSRLRLVSKILTVDPAFATCLIWGSPVLRIVARTSSESSRLIKFWPS